MAWRKALANKFFVASVVLIFSLFSLLFSICTKNFSIFSASGAIVTLGGVVLAARKIIRLGYTDFVKSEENWDLGRVGEKTEEEHQRELDYESYKVSIPLIISGTLVWAYGGFICI